MFRADNVGESRLLLTPFYCPDNVLMKYSVTCTGVRVTKIMALDRMIGFIDPSLCTLSLLQAI
jgi:hypothetical protein